MRRGIGAIFTTGVALVGATIVVANPVSAPPSDVRVPAVTLSADSRTSSAALDRALLEVIAQNPAQSGSMELFKRSAAGVVTNLTLSGGRAVEQALRVWPVVPGTPAPAPSPVPPEVVVDLLSGKPRSGSIADGPAAAVDDSALQHAVTSVADYVGYVSVRAVESTDAAGAIAAEPKRIADTLATLARGDVDTAITTALRAAAAPLGPPSMVVNAIRTEVRRRLTELVDRLLRPVLSPPTGVRATRPTTAERSTPLRSAVVHRRGSAVATKPTTVNGATDLTDGNKAVPHIKVPQSQVRQRTVAELNQARASLERLGDVLGKAVPPPQLPRPHRSDLH